jgi:hypothetical protein
VPLASRIGGKPLRVEAASSSGSEGGLALAGLPLAALAPAGLLVGTLLEGPALRGLPLAAAVGSVPGSHAGQAAPSERTALQTGHFRPVCCCQVSRSLAICEI